MVDQIGVWLLYFRPVRDEAPSLGVMAPWCGLRSSPRSGTFSASPAQTLSASSGSNLIAPQCTRAWVRNSILLLNGPSSTVDPATA